MQGKMVFSDVKGIRTSCYFNDLKSDGAIASLASRLMAFTNAEIIEASVKRSALIANPGGVPATDPPFDSAGVRAKLIFKITDAGLGADEPNRVALQLYAPKRTMFEDDYSVTAAAGAAIAALLSTATGYTMEFVGGVAVGVQI